MGCIGLDMKEELFGVELKQKDVVLESTLRFMGYEKHKEIREGCYQSDIFTRGKDDIILTTRVGDYHHILLTAPNFRTQETKRYVSGYWT